MFVGRTQARVAFRPEHNERVRERLEPVLYETFATSSFLSVMSLYEGDGPRRLALYETAIEDFAEVRSLALACVRKLRQQGSIEERELVILGMITARSKQSILSADFCSCFT